MFASESQTEDEAFDWKDINKDDQEVMEVLYKYGITEEDSPSFDESKDMETILSEKGIDQKALEEDLSKAVGKEKKTVSLFNPDTTVSKMLVDPFLMFGAMLLMISICSFFYADVENGYIKNIAGQMPKKGWTIVSKFVAAVPHNLIFMVTGVIGNLLGSLIVKHISAGDLAEGIGVFLLKLLLIQVLRLEKQENSNLRKIYLEGPN